jgi:hypothetical protein
MSDLMSGPEINRQPVWKVLYQAAILEFNPKILPQRVDEAKAAINAHWAVNKQVGDSSEDERLVEALWALDQLIKMRGVRSE